MTNLAHEALTAYLAGLTTKNGERIQWQDEFGRAVEIEITDPEKEQYVVYYQSESTDFWANRKEYWCGHFFCGTDF